MESSIMVYWNWVEIVFLPQDNIAGCPPNYIKQKTDNQVLEKNNQNTNKREMLITGRSIKTENILEVKHSAHLWLDNLVSELTGLQF